MESRLKTSAAGRRLIKRFEGFRRTAAPLPGGGWVIGYGHTRSAREGVSISEDDADKLLIYDLRSIEDAINTHVTAPLTQNQFDALASFALNIGRDNFLGSEVLNRLNQNRFLDAALAFDQWRATILEGRPVVVEALLRRRAAERALFLTPAGAQIATPSPEVSPAPDNGAQRLMVSVVTYRANLAGDAPGSFEPAPLYLSETDAEAEDSYLPARAPETVPTAPPSEAQPTGLPRAEDAIRDEPAEEIFVAGDGDQDLPFEQVSEFNRDAEALAEFEAIVQRPRPDEIQPAKAGPVSWTELARERVSLAEARAATAEAPKRGPASVARSPDAPPQSADAVWLEDDHASLERDRSAVWYALFLVIGCLLAAFGAWDTWRRASDVAREAFVYGPAVAAAGVLFMAVAGWFLIKRVLTSR